MKKLLFILILMPTLVFAQFDRIPNPNSGEFKGGLGLNWIDGDLYYSFNFRPELSFLNFGVGLDLKIDINKEGNIRKENFNDFSDYLSIIRYVRYGLKKDPVFVKLGAIDYYSLGHGSIMYMYNNSPSFDVRKSGLVVDLDFDKFGFESIYSKFGEAGVAGVRGYVRPMKFTTLGDIPIIGNLEVGATYSADFDQNSGIISGNYNPATRLIDNVVDRGRVSIFGLDLGLPVVRTGVFNLDLYLDYAKIVNYGSGVSAGIQSTFSGLGLVTASLKLERRINGDKYIPSYFNSMYEVQKFGIDSTVGTYPVKSKASILENLVNSDNGYYGELVVDLLNVFRIVGSYQRLDKTPESGIMHLEADLNTKDLPVMVRTGYDKINIKSEKDLFTLDERSYLYFEVGYKPVEYILVSMLYNWTFAPVRDKDDRVIDFKPQKRIEPRVSFIYPFNF